VRDFAAADKVLQPVKPHLDLKTVQMKFLKNFTIIPIHRRTTCWPLKLLLKLGYQRYTYDAIHGITDENSLRFSFDG
jgi:hypothetical protein